jgi:hypothetical protein
MDIQSEYERLYKHWQKELNQIGLSPFTQENFSKYKNVINEIDNLGDHEQDLIKTDIISSYRDNLKFLLSDFLKIREIKIINAALALQEIDFNNLIEAEIMYYQNLVSSIKGFEKMKALSIYEGAEDVKITNGDAEKVDDKKEIEQRGIEPIEIKVENNLEVSSDSYDSQERSSPTMVSDLTREKKKEDLNYTLLRFLKKTPALVGIDLVNYGPFEKENVANLPFKNASILLFEKFAEKIELI